MEEKQNPHSNDYQKILTYWSVIETLNPQGSQKNNSSDEQQRIYVIGSESDLLPWHPEHPHQGVVIAERARWVYTIFAGEIPLGESFNTIIKTFKGSEPKKQNLLKETFSLFSFSVDHFGRLQNDSITRSSYAWALGLIEKYGSESYERLTNFLDADEYIQRELKDFIYSTFSSDSVIGLDSNAQQRQFPETFDSITTPLIFSLYRFICDKLELPRFKESPSFTIRALPVSSESSFFESSGLLNSFFLNDLSRLIEECVSDNLSKAATQYLSEKIDIDQRVDIRRTNAAFVDSFAPINYPRGCWPNKGKHPLVFSQQFAINTFFKERTSQDGLFSVNGPPGTGKTTLLRDVIAHIVVERAVSLSQFKNPLEAFKRTIIKKGDGKESLIYQLEKSIQGFEIVVASSNNAAVENITLEIPGVDAIDPSYLAEADYFKTWAERLLNDQAWGLIAGRLGNKFNRDAFIKDFWLDIPIQDEAQISLARMINDKQDDGKGFEGYLRAHGRTSIMQSVDDEFGSENQTNNQSENQLRTWTDAVSSFNNALEKERKIRTVNQQVYERYVEMIPLKKQLYQLELELAQTSDASLSMTLREKINDLNGQINTIDQKIPYDFDRNRVPDFLKQSRPDSVKQELSAPWMDSNWYEARIAVFLSALNLHRTFVICNARIFRQNLKHFMLMLNGDASLGDEASHLWGTLFLLMPVISTTFASFSRLFLDMDKASLGWVLIDEAGQALPQAAIGTLWRAKRALLVGDPMQLEPVIMLDEKIQKEIATFADIDKKWVPEFNSAQELADRVGRFGTEIDDVWVGVPLRVHRRCDELIFNIANSMAYDDMMVFGTPKRSNLILPPSQWFHVDSSYSKGNWVEEEGHLLENLMESLVKANVDAKDVFLISPFADVIYHTRNLKKRYGIKSGTIHSVQGRENEIIILVLGGKPQVLGARLWATRRPNLLNVAITRAKRRLYVIGNKRLWSQLPNARVMARFLNQSSDLKR